MSPVAPADSRLAVADPALPGLAGVLDPLPLLDRLAPEWGVAAARITYLRYKPGTSLVAGLALTDDDGATRFAQAFALRPDASDKLAKVVLAGEADDVGRGAAVDAYLGVGLTDATADRHLPGVPRVLRGLTGDDDLTPLVYKPGRRWVARVDRGGVPALVKVHRPGRLPALRAGNEALHGLPVAGLLGVHERRAIVTSTWVPGIALDRLDGAGVAGLWSHAGAVLAQIHRRPPVAGLAPVDRAAALSAAVDAVHAVAPDLVPQARAAAGLVRAGLPDRGQLRGRGELRVVHGDFSADQVIVRPDLAALGSSPTPPTAQPSTPGAALDDTAAQPEVTIVDLDRVGLDDPVADLASWYGAQVAAGGEAGDPQAALAPLLAGYLEAGGPADLTRLRLHAAAAVLQRATEPFRRHADDWPRQVARLVAHAVELTV